MTQWDFGIKLCCSVTIRYQTVACCNDSVKFVTNGVYCDRCEWILVFTFTEMLANVMSSVLSIVKLFLYDIGIDRTMSTCLRYVGPLFLICKYK